MERTMMKRESTGSEGTPRADEIGWIHEWDDNDDELTFRVSRKSLCHIAGRACAQYCELKYTWNSTRGKLRFNKVECY
jgi:hypothetical protein